MSDLCMVECNEPRETAKIILENMNGILSEMNNQLCGIEDALYGAVPKETNMGAEPHQPPMLTMLREQRDFAEAILKRIAHIREGLW